MQSLSRFFTYRSKKKRRVKKFSYLFLTNKKKKIDKFHKIYYIILLFDRYRVNWQKIQYS
jgi:hypothetical protein